MTFSALAFVVSVLTVIYAFYFVASKKSAANADVPRRSPLPALAILLMLLIAAYSAFTQWKLQREQNRQYRIHVRVLDSSNKPISDASIWIANLSSKIARASEGVLLVSGSQLPPDKTLQVFASSGYGESGAVPLTIGKSTEVETEIRLKQLVAIRGIVVDAGARPIPFATIVSGSQTAKADEIGTFSILIPPSEISKGELSIQATAPGAQPTERIYKVDSGPVTVVLDRPNPAPIKPEASRHDVDSKPSVARQCSPPRQLLHYFAIGLAAQIVVAQEDAVESTRVRLQMQRSQHIAELRALGESEEIARSSVSNPGSQRAEQSQIEGAGFLVPAPYQTQVRELLDSLDATDLLSDDGYMQVRRTIESNCFRYMYGANCAGALTSLAEHIK